MIRGRHNYKLAQRVSENLLSWLQPRAYPGRGRRFPPILIVAMPKSGSVYIQRALSRTLQIPVRHVGGSGMFGASFGVKEIDTFKQGNVISREHLQPRDYQMALLRQYGIDRLVFHARDPIEVIESWTRYIDRGLISHGAGFATLCCEQVVPEVYLTWPHQDRLHWQIENQLPRLVQWTADWLDLAKQETPIAIHVATYAQLASDAPDYLEKILAFYEIDYQQDWLSLPPVRAGKHNVYTKQRVPIDIRLGDRLYGLAQSLVPHEMRQILG